MKRARSADTLGSLKRKLIRTEKEKLTLKTDLTLFASKTERILHRSQRKLEDIASQIEKEIARESAAGPPKPADMQLFKICHECREEKRKLRILLSDHSALREQLQRNRAALESQLHANVVQAITYCSSLNSHPGERA